VMFNNDYICSETLAERLNYADQIDSQEKVAVELDDNILTYIHIHKFNNPIATT